MIKKKKKLKEGYGAGFSFTSGRIGGMGATSRGGFGGASNMGGPNLMYTYEIKPLNHTLEQLPTVTNDQVSQIQIGSVITGQPIRSNANPSKKEVKGIVNKIIITDNGAIKYYVIQDEATQRNIKIDPLTVKLIIPEPIQYYADATDVTPSRRLERKKGPVKENKLVPESLDESMKIKKI